MTFGSLFAGIGGMDLGLERAGMSCAWQVEIDPWCRRVLAKHWPHVQRFEDVRTFALEEETKAIKVDCIAGGFPCQDISDAGHKVGLAGERSGLWREYARIIRVLRPRYVIVENVAALLKRGMGAVLADLARMRFNAEWRVLPASWFGYPHQRKRVFLVAYATGERCPTFDSIERFVCERGDTLEGQWQRQRSRMRQPCSSDDARIRLLPVDFDGRIDDGIPHRLDRVKGLGNAIVPAIAEYVGRRIMAASRSESQ